MNLGLPLFREIMVQEKLITELSVGEMGIALVMGVLYFMVGGAILVFYLKVVGWGG